MKKYFINIDKNNAPLEVDLTAENEVMFKGKSYEFINSYVSENVMILRINGKNYIIKAEKDSEAETDIADIAYKLDINSESYSVICKNELDVLTEKFMAGKSDRKFKNDVASPMPGAIVKINVKEGDLVKKGDVLLVLEAMKMENEIKASCNCMIKNILVDEKTSVEKGQLLIKLEIPEEN